MTGRRIGYIRMSSLDQNPEHQLDGIANGRKINGLQLEVASGHLKVSGR
jgi:DNA invertase Pin-like site-specific DNA recombinase